MHSTIVIVQVKKQCTTDKIKKLRREYGRELHNDAHYLEMCLHAAGSKQFPVTLQMYTLSLCTSDQKLSFSS